MEEDIADELNNANNVEEYEKFKWKYFFYCSFIFIFRLFFGPKKREKVDIDPLAAANSLIESNPSDDGTVKICQEFVKIHRIVENTKARKRLEKWATRVISMYLLVISSVFYFSYSDGVSGLYKINCPQPVMEFLLTTTTVNVIGLVVIVLRGHFQEKE